MGVPSGICLLYTSFDSLSVRPALDTMQDITEIKVKYCSEQDTLCLLYTSGAVVFGATLGVGVCFCAIPILLYEGGLTLLAGLLEPYLQGALLDQICMVGYAMVACIGINFISREAKIKTANLLPALLVPAVWSFLSRLFT